MGMWMLPNATYPYYSVYLCNCTSRNRLPKFFKLSVPYLKYFSEFFGSKHSMKDLRAQSLWFKSRPGCFQSTTVAPIFTMISIKRTFTRIIIGRFQLWSLSDVLLFWFPSHTHVYHTLIDGPTQINRWHLDGVMVPIYPTLLPMERHRDLGKWWLSWQNFVFLVIWQLTTFSMLQ